MPIYLSINGKKSLDFSNHSSGTLKSLLRHSQWMNAPALCKCTHSTLHVARCTLHTQLSRRIHRNRIAASNLDRRQLCSANLERASADGKLCHWVSELAAAHCNLQRAAHCSPCHTALAVCMCVCVCVGQWPDPFNKAVATLTRQGLSRLSSCPPRD